MPPQPSPDLPEDKGSGGKQEAEETNVLIEESLGSPPDKAGGAGGWMPSPVAWFRMLVRELHWSFVLGVVATYGINQGLGGGIVRVASDYYWKDVQKVQPSAAQVYHGVTRPLCPRLPLASSSRQLPASLSPAPPRQSPLASNSKQPWSVHSRRRPTTHPLRPSGEAAIEVCRLQQGSSSPPPRRPRPQLPLASNNNSTSSQIAI